MTLQEFIIKQAQDQVMEQGMDLFNQMLKDHEVDELDCLADYKNGTVTFTIKFDLFKGAVAK
ncbi:hypothetical protein ABE236_18275 [Priestia endophytica]|uniref:hypothetical protein n=1 Tax=Priestia endophytica TaxID=135735 RepID=UPI003D2E6D21